MLFEMLGGQEMVGACVSFTVTRKVQVLVRLAPSIAFHVTVVWPIGNAEPLAKPLTIITEPSVQLSVNVGVA